MSNVDTKKYLSVCIPTYEMHGLGPIFLKHTFDILTTQTFKDFDIIISDNSQNNSIKDVCDKYRDTLVIHYYRNENAVKNMTSNVNNSIKKATGKIIKMLFLDDFLYKEDSLKQIVENFNLEKDNWMVTACEHSIDGTTYIKPFYPRYNRLISFGYNTISSPSVLTIKNQSPLLFDENLIWLMDCDYYQRLYNKFGNPKILNEINVVNRMGSHQATHRIINRLIRIKELLYVLRKHVTIKKC